MSETIADIVNAIRENAESQHDAWQNDPNEFKDGLTWSAYLSDLADRIEESATAEKSSSVGNAAAMRDALAEQLRYWDAHVRTRDEEEMRKRTEAALAAPPRNCDVENCAWDAQREFRRTFRDAYGNPAPSGDDAAYWPTFVNWLFAQAEGGAE